MEERSVVHSTFVLERNYPVTPERVFGAFADPGKKRRWFVESDHNVVEHHEVGFSGGGEGSGPVSLQGRIAAAGYRLRE